MKRIIASILVVVMLAFSLVSCGYSFADDDMAKYATFSDESKAAFEQALIKILIEDGDFTTDDAIRAEKVIESVYAAIADKSDGEKKTEGTPTNRDVIYYSYYATAEFDGVVAQFYGDKMNSSSPASIQLRPSNNYDDNKIIAGIAALLGSHDFKNMAYSSVATGTAVEGDVAFVTYQKTVGTEEPVSYTNQKIVIGAAPAEGQSAATFESYLCGKTIGSSTAITKFEEKDANGAVTATYTNIKINFVSSRTTNGTTQEGNLVYVTYSKTVAGGTKEEFKTQPIVVGAITPEGGTVASFASYLAGQKVGALSDVTVKEGEVEVTYSGITINWIANNAKELATVSDIPFDEKTLVNDSTGTERDLNGKTLTYYIYPVNYKVTPLYTAELLVDKVLFNEEAAEDVENACEALYEIIFVNEYAAIDEDLSEEDIEKEIEKIKENLVKYKTADGLSIADLAKKILAYYEDLEKAETARDDAIKARQDAQTAYDEAKSAYEDAQKPDSGVDADALAKLKETFEKADKALNGVAGEEVKTGALANEEKAKAAYDKVGTDRTNNIKALLDIVGEGETVALREKIEKNYMILNYNYLQQSYNEEIKVKLAKEIYHFLSNNITTNIENLPKDAVKDAYKQIYETYENEFYTGKVESSGSSSSATSNYSAYNGKFENYLIDQVKEDILKDKTAEITFRQAKDAIWKKAKESVQPIVALFLAAQRYNQVITDADYDELKEELEEYYYYYVLYYKNFSIEENVGKTNIATAAQFNKLMDWFLSYDEVKAEPDANGYVKITYSYNNELFGDFEFGTPASENAEATK